MGLVGWVSWEPTFSDCVAGAAAIPGCLEHLRVEQFLTSAIKTGSTAACDGSAERNWVVPRAAAQ